MLHSFPCRDRRRPFHPCRPCPHPDPAFLVGLDLLERPRLSTIVRPLHLEPVAIERDAKAVLCWIEIAFERFIISVSFAFFCTFGVRSRFDLHVPVLWQGFVREELSKVGHDLVGLGAHYEELCHRAVDKGVLEVVGVDAGV